MELLEGKHCETTWWQGAEMDELYGLAVQS